MISAAHGAMLFFTVHVYPYLTITPPPTKKNKNKKKDKNKSIINKRIVSAYYAD